MMWDELEIHLIDRIGLHSWEDKFCNEFALEILHTNGMSVQMHACLDGVACLEIEFLCTNGQGLLASSLEILQEWLGR